MDFLMLVFLLLQLQRVIKQPFSLGSSINNVIAYDTLLSTLKLGYNEHSFILLHKSSWL